MRARLRWLAVGLIAGTYLVGAALLLLWPNGEQVRRLLLDVYLYGLYDLGLPPWVTPGVYSALGNVLLFAPAGLALTLALGRRRVWWAVALCVLASVGVELAQATLLSARRVPDVGDVLCNTIGSLLGCTAGTAWLRWTERRARQTAAAPR
jgi:glycopeptide antibiotics resistance protein